MLHKEGDGPNAKLREMQQNTHGLLQLIGATSPDVPNQTRMPQLFKQMFNVCPIPPMHITVAGPSKFHSFFQ